MLLTFYVFVESDIDTPSLIQWVLWRQELPRQGVDIAKRGFVGAELRSLIHQYGQSLTSSVFFISPIDLLTESPAFEGFRWCATGLEFIRGLCRTYNQNNHHNRPSFELLRPEQSNEPVASFYQTDTC